MRRSASTQVCLLIFCDFPVASMLFPTCSVAATVVHLRQSSSRVILSSAVSRKRSTSRKSRTNEAREIRTMRDIYLGRFYSVCFGLVASKTVTSRSQAHQFMEQTRAKKASISLSCAGRPIHTLYERVDLEDGPPSFPDQLTSTNYNKLHRVSEKHIYSYYWL